MSLPDLMGLNVTQALKVTTDMKSVQTKLKVLDDLGLGYLTLGEATPGLSGGEAQRLKLAGDMGRGQADTVFIFDEPTIGLHPENVKTLMAVFDQLIDAGATVIVIEHDLDVIRSADWMIDLGPGAATQAVNWFMRVCQVARKPTRRVSRDAFCKGFLRVKLAFRLLAIMFNKSCDV